MRYFDDSSAVLGLFYVAQNRRRTKSFLGIGTPKRERAMDFLFQAILQEYATLMRDGNAR